MISFGRDVRVFVATQPIDFRKGVHGLVALVAKGLAGDPTAATFSSSAPSAPTG